VTSRYSATPARRRPFALLLALMMTAALLVMPPPAFASHLEEGSLTLSDDAAGSTATYTIIFRVGGGNGNLASGIPKLRFTFPAETIVTGLTFDAAASGIGTNPLGPFDAFPALAAGGDVVIDGASRTVTIGPLETATTAGTTSFRVVLTGVVNRTSSGSTSLTAQVLDASDNINTSGSITFALQGASASTGSASSVVATSATLEGTSSSPGGSEIVERGILVATTSDPILDAVDVVKFAAATAGTGSFTVNATGLTADTTYYYRAFARTDGETFYGRTQTFTTLDSDPPPEPSASTAGPELTLTCSPSEALAGQLVTCTALGGEPGVEVLWTATFPSITVTGSLVFGFDGSAAFSFIVPMTAAGASAAVELVDWLTPVELIIGSVAPNRIGAGEGFSGVIRSGVASPSLATAVLLAGIGAVLRRRRRRLSTTREPVLPVRDPDGALHH